MQEFKWVILKKNSLIILSLLALIIMGAFYGLKGIYYQHTLAPEEFLLKAIQKTGTTHTYRYRVVLKLKGNDKTKAEYVARVIGERSGNDCVRIKGYVLNTPVEFMQIENTSYLRDYFFGNWLTFKENYLTQSDLFATELTPLASLDFDRVTDVRYDGKEKLKGRQMTILGFYPEVRNSFLREEFVDLNYKLWINPADFLIYKAEINGKMLSNKQGRLFIGLELWDYNGDDINIDPPKIK